MTNKIEMKMIPSALTWHRKHVLAKEYFFVYYCFIIMNGKKGGMKWITAECHRVSVNNPVFDAVVSGIAQAKKIPIMFDIKDGDVVTRGQERELFEYYRGKK